MRNEVRPRNRADRVEPSPPSSHSRPTNLLPHGRLSSLISPSGRRLSSLVSPSGRRLSSRLSLTPATLGRQPPRPCWRRRRHTTDLAEGWCVEAAVASEQQASRGLASYSSLHASSSFPTAGTSFLAGGLPRASAATMRSPCWNWQEPLPILPLI